jgi:uncharacterized membrane protein YraQ (UPF0718 family)
VSLRDELREVARDDRPVRRGDLAHAHAFLRAHPAISAVYGTLMLLAAAASAAGWLRWTATGARFGGAVIFALLAGYFFTRAWQGHRS